MLKRRSLFPYFLVFPAVAFLILLYAYPYLLTFIQSFQDVKLFGGKSSWVNFENYKFLLGDSNFIKNLKVTGKYTLITLILKIGLGFLFALLLNADIYGRKFIRFLFLLPWAMPQVAVAVVWKWIYDGKYGYLNQILSNLSLIEKNISWLADPEVTLFAVAVVDAWMGWPLITMMFLSGLEAIPDSLYEAAQMDGANSWSRFVHITLSEIRSIFLVVLTLVTIWTFNSFNVIYVLTQGGPLRSTENLMLRVYNESFQNFNFGVSSALTIIILLLLIILTSYYVYQMTKEE